MIPKIIHYCWFGGNPLPELAQKCIASWKQYCPDFEIKLWNEDNFDVNCCKYVKQAYDAKKWAFVSDYARFKILYDHGGIYFDTDVELIKPLQPILDRGAFMGAESFHGSRLLVNPGLGIGSCAKHPIYKEIIEAYHTRHFLRQNGSYDLTTVVQFTTELLCQHRLQNINALQIIEGICIYPPDYFCPKDMHSGTINLTDNTYAIHHFDASWCTPQQLYSHRIAGRLSKIFPRAFASRLGYVISICKYEGFSRAAKVLFSKLLHPR